jgi:hypothetical protein
MSKNGSAYQSGARACPRCGQNFTCGLAAVDDHCWCFDLPHVISPKDASREGCLCPNCLGKLIDTIQKRDQASAG